MKPSAFLINLARGPIAEEQALYRALRDCVIGGAALDTWWRYPSADDPAPRPSRYPFHELEYGDLSNRAPAFACPADVRFGGACDGRGQVCRHFRPLLSPKS